MEAILREFGCQTTVASTGEQALASFARATPDLLIVDVTLPDRSGTELCRRIKMEPKTRRVPW